MVWSQIRARYSNFQAWLKHSVEQMQALDLVEFSGPMGQRQSDIPMYKNDDR